MCKDYVYLLNVYDALCRRYLSVLLSKAFLLSKKISPHKGKYSGWQGKLCPVLKISI